MTISEEAVGEGELMMSEDIEESSVMMMTMSEDSSVRRSKTCSRTDHNQSLAVGQHCARQHCHSFVRLITSRTVKFTIHV